MRTADVTDAHGFWNHACVLLWPVGAPSLPARITVDFPQDWDLACALSIDADPPDHAAPTGCRRITLRADDMEHAYDSPCLVGTFARCSWQVAEVAHEAVLDGLAGVKPPATLIGDLKRVVEAAAAVFDAPLPYARYLFLCLFTADGHGGLEHRDSTTLLMSRTALHSDKGYREFLALAAHELFHAWNVKRMRPVEFWQYDYENENYTTFLWLLEGWTAYYDDLLCLRAGLMSRSDYLAIVAKSIQAVLTSPGRLRSSLSESSFDAWIRLYRPDENTRNSSQNYYVNGGIAAMCLDLMVRITTGGQRSLDDVLRRLYRGTFGANRGFTAEDVRAAITAETNAAIAEQALALVHGNLTPDLAALLAGVGIRLVVRDTERPYLGIQFEPSNTVVAAVTAGSARACCWHSARRRDPGDRGPARRQLPLAGCVRLGRASRHPTQPLDRSTRGHPPPASHSLEQPRNREPRDGCRGDHPRRIPARPVVARWEEGHRAGLEPRVRSVAVGLVGTGSAGTPHHGARAIEHDLDRRRLRAAMCAIAVWVARTPLAAAPCVLAGLTLRHEGALDLASRWVRHAQTTTGQRKRRTTPRTTPRNCTRDVKIGSMLALAGCRRTMPLLSR